MNVSDLTRPIIGIENRTAQEAFDIMCDRIRAALTTPPASPEDIVAAGTALVEVLDRHYANSERMGNGIPWNRQSPIGLAITRLSDALRNERARAGGAT